METGAGGSQAQRSGNTARGIPPPPPQPPEEPNLLPECRRPSGTESDLILQPEWRRRRPSAPPSEPSNRGGEEKILLQPEWRRSKPSASVSVSASAGASASTSVWEPEWRRSRTSSTAFPWDQNYSVRKPSASSSSGVERRGDPNDLWRAAPATGIYIVRGSALFRSLLALCVRILRLRIGIVETAESFLSCQV